MNQPSELHANAVWIEGVLELAEGASEVAPAWEIQWGNAGEKIGVTPPPQGFGSTLVARGRGVRVLGRLSHNRRTRQVEIRGTWAESI